MRSALLVAERSRLERAYRESVFHRMSAGVRLAYRGEGCRPETRLPPLDDDAVLDVVQMRALQVRLGALVRADEGRLGDCEKDRHRCVCAPHVGHALGDRDAPGTPLDGSKWTAWQKSRASLAQTLLYVVRACRGFRGAVFGLSVANDEHSNMVYVDLATDPPRCYLFEPNGTAFASTTGGLTRLQDAVRRANARTGGAVHPDVLLADVHGVQRALGTDAEDPRAYEGMPICGAVTHWVVHLFATSAQATEGGSDFRAFVDGLARAVLADPAEHRRRVVAFLGEATKRLGAGSAGTPEASRYGAALHRALEGDLTSDRFASLCLCQSFEVDVEYTCHLGPLEASGVVHVDACGDVATDLT